MEIIFIPGDPTRSVAPAICKPTRIAYGPSASLTIVGNGLCHIDRRKATSLLYRPKGLATECPGACEFPLASPAGIGFIRLSGVLWFALPPVGCGRSSEVEHNLAKVGVVSSNLIARSN